MTIRPIFVVKKDHKKTPLMQIAEEIASHDKMEREIGILKKEIVQIAQMIHQSYHGADGPDVDHGTWESCNRGICQRARAIFRPERPRGRP